MKWIYKLLLPSLSILFFTSCQGHFSSKETAPTMSIPYVEGDSDGKMTSFLVDTIAKDGAFEYVQSGGSLTLNVKILDHKYDNIGFRYDPKRTKKQVKRVIPSESRSKLLAEVELVDNTTQQVVLGPAHIVAYADYDHQNYSINNDINVFSLGQLSDIDTASDVIDIASFRSLAREISDYLHAHRKEINKSHAE